jgi:hypothetical protein
MCLAPVFERSVAFTLTLSRRAPKKHAPSRARRGGDPGRGLLKRRVRRWEATLPRAPRGPRDLSSDP